MLSMQVDRKPCTKPFDGTDTASSTKQELNNKTATVPLRFNYWIEHAHIHDHDITNTVFKLFPPSSSTEFFSISVIDITIRLLRIIHS